MYAQFVGHRGIQHSNKLRLYILEFLCSFRFFNLLVPIKGMLLNPQWRIQGLILRGAWGGAKVQKVLKLAKHSVKQRKTTFIEGGNGSLLSPWICHCKPKGKRND